MCRPRCDGFEPGGRPSGRDFRLQAVAPAADLYFNLPAGVKYQREGCHVKPLVLLLLALCPFELVARQPPRSAPQPPVKRPCPTPVLCCPAVARQEPPCRIGCSGSPPKKTHDAQPKLDGVKTPYPAGMVILELLVDEAGVPQSSCVLRGVRDDFDRAAQEATMNWRFKPLVLRIGSSADAEPVPVVFTVTVDAPNKDR